MTRHSAATRYDHVIVRPYSLAARVADPDPSAAAIALAGSWLRNCCWATGGYAAANNWRSIASCPSLPSGRSARRRNCGRAARSLTAAAAAGGRAADRSRSHGAGHIGEYFVVFVVVHRQIEDQRRPIRSDSRLHRPAIPRKPHRARQSAPPGTVASSVPATRLHSSGY